MVLSSYPRFPLGVRHLVFKLCENISHRLLQITRLSARVPEISDIPRTSSEVIPFLRNVRTGRVPGTGPVDRGPPSNTRLILINNLVGSTSAKSGVARYLLFPWNGVAQAVVTRQSPCFRQPRARPQLRTPQGFPVG